MSKRPKGLKYQKHKENPTSFKKGFLPWNKDKKGSQEAWNKGLTKETDERVGKYAKTIKGLGIKPPITEMTLEAKLKIQRRMRGDNNPAKCPAVKEKIRNTLKETYKNNPLILEGRKPSGLNQYGDYFSSIEKKIMEELKNRSLPFLHNYRIGRYFADFLIPDRVVIECDGEYWHNKRRDEDSESKRERYLHSLGYFTFHLSEKRINKDPKECVDAVEMIMKGLENNAGGRFRL